MIDNFLDIYCIGVKYIWRYLCKGRGEPPDYEARGLQRGRSLGQWWTHFFDPFCAKYKTYIPNKLQDWGRGVNAYRSHHHVRTLLAKKYQTTGQVIKSWPAQKNIEERIKGQKGEKSKLIKKSKNGSKGRTKKELIFVAKKHTWWYEKGRAR